MTQREVANKCGWSTNYINAIINGKKGCNEETMLKIKQYYPDLQFKKIIKIRYKVDRVSEEVKIKISQPMFECGELERFDNNIHSIVEEYSKMQLHEKDQILTQRIIMKQEDEIEKLKKERDLHCDFNNYLLGKIEKAGKEIERLHSIIKEVREYIEEWQKFPHTNGSTHKELKNLIDILDKENK